MKRPLPKPRWLIFANATRVKLGEIEDIKSGRRTKDAAQAAFAKARDEMGYPGNYSDWCYLIGLRPRGRRT